MFIIRPATLSDGAFVKDLMVESLKLEGIYSEEYHRKYPDLDLENLPTAYTTDGGGFLIAESEGQVIGSLGFFTVDGKFAQLRRFYVHADFRGRGIGKALLERTFQLCASKGFMGVVAVTELELKRAFDVYTAAGFKVFKSDGINYMIKFFDLEAEKRIFPELAEKDWIFDFDGKQWKKRKN